VPSRSESMGGGGAARRCEVSFALERLFIEIRFFNRQSKN
jgi:hypothetical protein